jgi:hypothetical protein
VSVANNVLIHPHRGAQRNRIVERAVAISTGTRMRRTCAAKMNDCAFALGQSIALELASENGHLVGTIDSLSIDCMDSDRTYL